MDSVKVAKLVEEYLKAQSLKILPQAPFGDAVTQFVDKDDKHAMEQFVSESLAGQVKQMLSLEDNYVDLDDAMAKIKESLEQKFASGQYKRSTRRVYKPKPDEWDSDMDGHWEDQPEALEHVPLEPEKPSQPAPSRGRGQKPARAVFIDDEDEEMDGVAENDSEELIPARKTTRGRTTTTTTATKAKAAPKAPAKKAPAKGRGRASKQTQNEEDEDEDVFMEDDVYDPPAPPPKRTTATRSTATRSQPTRSQASSRASASASASKTRQTKLNFSQKATQQEPLEISDDEISDDPFESAPATRSRRR